MIIHSGEIEIKDGLAILSTRVEFQLPRSGLPERLWYAFEERHAQDLNTRCDAFAAGLILLAAHLEEPLQVRGPVSARLAYGLREYLQIFHQWAPGDVSLVPLEFEQPEHRPAASHTANVAAAFSGGADSFFTLHNHLPDRASIPGTGVSHCLFVHGFDIPLERKDAYQVFFDRYQAMLQPMGIDLIPATTNLLEFYRYRMKWELVHGGPLASIAHALGPFLKRFYIPSTFSYLEIKPQGTSPVSDHWLSSESLDIVHDGAGFDRLQKLALLSGWSPAQNHLRVCVSERLPAGVLNCGKCAKCLRNLLMLESAGMLKDYPSLTTRFKYAQMLPLLISGPAPKFYRQIRRSALARRRYDLALLTFIIDAVNNLRAKAQAWWFRRLSREQRYQLKRRHFGRADAP